MPHKKEYIRNGDEISNYNKKYYRNHKKEFKARAKRRLELNPNVNKDYYALHKEHINKLNKDNYRKHKEKIEG